MKMKCGKWLNSVFLNTDLENRHKIIEIMDINPNAMFLDCGCSNGLFSGEIADAIGTNLIYGIDFQAENCTNGDIEICKTDLNKAFPFQDEVFDVVHANQVIEHLSGSDSFIKEIYRVLKPGGYAVISTPNLGSLHNIISLIFGYQPFSAHVSNEVIVGNPLDPKNRMKHTTPGEIHLRVFSYKGLKELAEYHGFVTEAVYGIGFYPFPKNFGRIFAKIDPRHSVYLTARLLKPLE